MQPRRTFAPDSAKLRHQLALRQLQLIQSLALPRCQTRVHKTCRFQIRRVVRVAEADVEAEFLEVIILLKRFLLRNLR